MTVSCKMSQCPYYDKRGFCAKTIAVSINQLGMCSILWRKGKQRMLPLPFTNDLYPKNPITIIDVAETQVSDVIEEKNEEEAESREEDSTNGAAAF